MNAKTNQSKVITSESHPHEIWVMQMLQSDIMSQKYRSAAIRLVDNFDDTETAIEFLTDAFEFCHSEYGYFQNDTMNYFLGIVKDIYNELSNPEEKMKSYSVFAGKIRVMSVGAKNEKDALKEAEREMSKSNRRQQYPGEIRVEEKTQ